MPSSAQPDLPNLLDNRKTGGASVRYRVRHANVYRYGREIMLANHLLHLTPRPAAGQRLVSFRLDVEPQPSIRSEHPDVFGNPVTYVEMHEPHLRLLLGTEFEVEVDEARTAPEELDIPWEQLRDRLAHPSAPVERMASAYGFPSPMVAPTPELQAFAAESFAAGRGIGEAAMDLTLRIFRGFKFDAGATTIATPISEVFANRRGVCQDFAHLQIGCLRALGLAARYVSGYLRTIPPAGRPRSVGSDVSHAWLSVWCGDEDWLDLDPTNGRPGSSDLITLAWGRDYGDISPTRGVILGSSVQHLSVSVDVETLEPRAEPGRSGPVADGAEADMGRTES